LQHSVDLSHGLVITYMVNMPKMQLRITLERNQE